MSSDSEDRGETARALLELLYPPPNRLEQGSAPERARFVAVPHARAPRLLVDARSTRLAASALRRQSSSARLRMRAARSLLSIVVRTGLYDRLPGVRLVVRGPADAATIHDPLREILDHDDVHIAVPIGPKRANRKPVLQVSDSRGETLAFVKVGHNDLTRSLVDEEARSLATLNAVPWREVRVPQVLAALEWNNLSLLVLEPLSMQGRRCQGDRARERLLDVVTEIAAKGGERDVPWHEHPLRSHLQHRLEQADGAAAWLRQLQRLPGEAMLRTGWWHGDLNPGNVFLTAAACPVWDWERFDTDVPVGIDLLHHDLQASITHRLVDPSKAAAELLRSAYPTLAPWGHDLQQAHVVCRAYLIMLAERYLSDDQAGAGASLGRVDEWLLPVLEECSDDVSRH